MLLYPPNVCTLCIVLYNHIPTYSLKFAKNVLGINLSNHLRKVNLRIRSLKPLTFYYTASCYCFLLKNPNFGSVSLRLHIYICI